MNFHSKLLVFLLSLSSFNFFAKSAIAQSTPDPGLAGTYTVTKDTFDLGELAYKPDSFPNFVELRGSVHYPTSLSGGPFPVIVLLHGRHVTTYRTSAPGTTSLSWPPASGYQSIISFDGYDYFARTMASHGYIVISVSANAINAADASLSDRGMNARGQLVQKHLDMWNAYNTIGGAPFGTKFVGKLDMTRIGTMGHSRGGEGVVYNALLNRSLGSPYGIKAVITLAPVDFYRKKLNGIPLMNIAPYCDGDVSDLQGVHFYDDVRYNDTTDTAAKYSILMMGANHNYFNTVWTPGSYIAGTSDDWGATSTDPFCGASVTGNGRLDTGEQKAAFNAYGAAFFRMHVGGDTSFAPILRVEDIYPPTSSRLDTTQVFVSYHPGNGQRKDVNRIDTAINISTNTLAGTVIQSGLTSGLICGGGLSIPLCGISTAKAKEPHRGTATIKGLAQMSMRWRDTTAYYQNEIPIADQNSTMFKSISFRVSQNYKDTRPTGTDLDFTIELEDASGKIAKKIVSDYSGALFFQPGTRTNVLPKTMFNTVKIPLIDFKGIDQTKLKYIRFKYNKLDSGAVLVSDIALIDIVKPCGIVNALFKDSLGKGYEVFFKDTSMKNVQDSLVWLWKFGDPASGLADTSTLQNPKHIYSTPGAYTACLYLSAYRTTGLVCKDTLCRTITLLPNSINEQSMHHIILSPNPVSNYLNIYGTAPGDAIVLQNLYGQKLLNEEIINNQIVIPTLLPSGIYIATIITKHGRSQQKLLIAR